jgi:hypothetical protein
LLSLGNLAHSSASSWLLIVAFASSACFIAEMLISYSLYDLATTDNVQHPAQAQSAHG